MPGNNLIAVAITGVLCVLWLRLNDFLAHKKIISGPISRKIIHIGTGPIFVLCWLLFTNDFSSRFLAAIIPLLITIQFFLIGIGVIKDQASVDAMSRTGDKAEILKGPLYYGIVFVILTLVYWRDSLIGIIALMMLCGGDGLADIVGKKIKSSPIPWSKNKTYAGSLAVFAGGFALSIMVVEIYILAGAISGSLTTYLGPIVLISIIGMAIESLPFKDIDNITLPLASIILGHLLF